MKYKEGYVYLAEAAGFYKIGISKAPDERIKHFSTIMPIDVNIVHVFWADDYKAAENWLHKAYESWRYRGEWFKLPDGLVELIKQIAAFVNGAAVWHPTDDELDWYFSQLTGVGDEQPIDK